VLETFSSTQDVVDRLREIIKSNDCRDVRIFVLSGDQLYITRSASGLQFSPKLVLPNNVHIDIIGDTDVDLAADGCLFNDDISNARNDANDTPLDGGSMTYY
jgi:uncharacterized Fe-S cluster-containing radical SAM superfamily protein